MFLDTNSTSSLNFGNSADVSGGVSTPLYAKETFYYLSLEKLSVAGNEVSVNNPTSIKAGNGDGNIIIDSGTTLTFLPPDTFDGLVRIVKRAVKLTPVEDSRGTFGLCYDGLTVNDVPDIVLHFTGADVTLKPINTFLRPYSDNNLVCFAFMANGDLPILGNLAQQNFNVEYDLGEEKLTFKPTNCAKL
ncbi:Aspartic proteinase CDR1 [Acorus calamus]|uniref:Aspartic proteinase CDR1 n=1 Tax=Acorus calamus TaxID=4465 RepID=A0AAV9FFY4_ACOCL|nr:Aspartic proteinase CDR1 [Acorus calamus]